MVNILLIEPSYKNKYPPLGLMKIAAFHKKRGDHVRFVKGLNIDLKKQKWSRIYITSLFSFQWNQTIKTIHYYKKSLNRNGKIFIGGIMASIMTDEIEEETGIRPIVGQLNESGKIGLKDDHLIDGMVPDYSILDEIDYEYPASNAYFSYTTRGCIRRCNFCAVRILEPEFVPYISLGDHIKEVDRKFGVKRNLLLLDNNVLASPDFERIVDEIKDIGFYKGAKLNRALRYVDFNQGVDARLLTKKKMRKLAELPIKPLRIAFDSLKIKDKYIKCIEWAAEFGIRHLSNYILFNFRDDTPEEFYERLRINVELNARLDTGIYSFPMKYVPIRARQRTYIGPHWNKRYLRGIQCILSATHGVVGTKLNFFETAFGRDLAEFKKIISMPDNYIIYRSKHANNGAMSWSNDFDVLAEHEQNDLVDLLSTADLKELNISEHSRFETLLEHYL